MNISLADRRRRPHLIAGRLWRSSPTSVRSSVAPAGQSAAAKRSPGRNLPQLARERREKIFVQPIRHGLSQRPASVQSTSAKPQPALITGASFRQTGDRARRSDAPEAALLLQDEVGEVEEALDRLFGNGPDLGGREEEPPGARVGELH